MQASSLPLPGRRPDWSASSEDAGTESQADQTFREHFNEVWRFLRRLGFSVDLADDAAQELFFVAHRKLAEVDPARRRAFLLGSALRIAKNMIRRHDREVPTSPDEVDDALTDDETPEQQLDDEKSRALVYRLLAELDEDLRVVFVLYEIEELTMQAIADLLSIPMGTVASRLRRARDEFRERLERHRKRERGAL